MQSKHKYMHKAETSEASQNSTTPQEALVTLQPLALMLCHRIIEHSGCIKQLVAAPAARPTKTMLCSWKVLHACTFIYDAINKNLFMKI